MMRRKSRAIHAGAVTIGGDAPVSVQSMTNTDTRDAMATLSQIEALAKAGADILVSGSSVFKASDPKDMIARMHGAEH